MTLLFYTKADGVAAPEKLLSEYRRAKNTDRSLNSAAELLIIYALRTFGYFPAVPLDIRTGEHGKPYILNAPHFNISHSGGIVMCAVSDKEVGVDVQEEVAPERAEKISRRFFTIEEQAETGRFTELWTKKEAYIKFTGMGLSTSLSSFSALDELPGCHIYSGIVENCRYAVCAPEETEPQVIFVSREELLSGI